MHGKALWMGAIAIALILMAVAALTAAAGGRGKGAKATIHDGAGRKIGVASLSQDHDGVRVSVSVEAASSMLGPGSHGFHIHSEGSCIAPDFLSAGGHYNPTSEIHGAHKGDLPSLLVNPHGEKGTARASFVTKAFNVSDVTGRAFIIHELADNFGNVPVGSGPTQYTPNTTGTAPETATGLTAATGNAGARKGCGIIKEV